MLRFLKLLVFSIFQNILLRRLLFQSRHLTYLTDKESRCKSKEDWNTLKSKGARFLKLKSITPKVKRVSRKLWR